MPDQRTSAALARIERALARIQAAADRPAPPAPDDRPLRELREVHQALRTKVEGAIAQIDELLAERSTS